MEFTLYATPDCDPAAAGCAVWSESQDVTLHRGRFSVALGSVVDIRDTIADAEPLFLGIAVDGVALAGRQRIVPVPYSVWSATAADLTVEGDLLHHRTRRGLPFRILVVVDEFTREILALRVATSFTARDVIRILAEVFAEYGTPSTLRSDNGPAFIGTTFQRWLRERGIAQELSRPGKPCDNGLCESTNGRIRDELLRPHVFDTIEEAADAVAAFREDYNTIRPHSALDGLAPSTYHQRLAPPTFAVA